jgi:hypothetical protein
VLRPQAEKNGPLWRGRRPHLTGSGSDLELDEAAAEPLARRPEGRTTKKSARFNLQADLDVLEQKIDEPRTRS